MKSHDLAKQLLKGTNIDVIASIDISTNDDDHDRRIFCDECFGVNNISDTEREIVILFSAKPKDNYNNNI